MCFKKHQLVKHTSVLTQHRTGWDTQQDMKLEGGLGTDYGSPELCAQELNLYSEVTGEGSSFFNTWTNIIQVSKTC